jgi:hypothetical protein
MANLKEDLTVEINQFEGGLSNFRSTRYIYKRNPNLWQEILKATEFLPQDAKAKQRVWHILNDVYYRPTCPITGEYTKWWDNRYCEYANTSALNRGTLEKRKQTYKERTGYEDWGKDPNVNKKRKRTYEEKLLVGEVIPYNKRRKVCGKLRRKKAEQTWLEKYGTENPFQQEWFRDKFRAPDRPERHAYYESVILYTRDSWRQNFSKINPKWLPRGDDYHLDHIYSIHQGYKDGIHPMIIGHWSNLRMITKDENMEKNRRCDKTIEQLFEDYYESS